MLCYIHGASFQLFPAGRVMQPSFVLSAVRGTRGGWRHQRSVRVPALFALWGSDKLIGFACTASPRISCFFFPCLKPFFFNGISAQSTPGARCIQRSSNDTPNWQRQPGYHQLKAIRRGTKRKKEENGG